MVDLSLVINGFNKLKEISDRVKNSELREAYIDLKEQWIEAKDEILNLREEVKRFKEVRNIGEDLVHHKSLYYMPGNKVPGPYCPKCWHKDKLTMPLFYEFRSGLKTMKSGAKYHCKNCNSLYDAVKNYPDESFRRTLEELTIEKETNES